MLSFSRESDAEFRDRLRGKVSPSSFVDELEYIQEPFGPFGVPKFLCPTNRL